MNIRIPWRARTAAYRVYQYACSILSRIPGRRKKDTRLSFRCQYQQTTGASVAISCIANQLSQQHPVDAYIKPLSAYSRLLSLRVRQYFSPRQLKGRIVFVDIEQKSKTIESLLASDKLVILTCHAFPTVLHSVPQGQLKRNLQLVSQIHFVSAHQRSEFINDYPEIEIARKSFVIPNYTRQSSKTAATRSIGLVGHLNREPKKGLDGVQLAHESSADSIECWGSDSIYGLDDPDSYTKLHINGWTDSVRHMHSTFDVLLCTSQSETFGLVVVEALSAGIPCLLSDLPVFRELYSGCEGVKFLSGDNQQDIQTLNCLLDQAPKLKKGIIAFWTENFSNETISNAWRDRVTGLGKYGA